MSEGQTFTMEVDCGGILTHVIPTPKCVNCGIRELHMFVQKNIIHDYDKKYTFYLCFECVPKLKKEGVNLYEKFCKGLEVNYDANKA